MSGLNWRRLTLEEDKVQLAFEFEFESAELERGGTGRRFDRPSSDADSDAHGIYFVKWSE